MRFDRIKIRNMGAFRGEQEIDLTQPGVVAIVGRNGAGKSTLLELLLGAVYRSCPTRGTLPELATSRDSSVEVGLEYAGHRYTFRQLVDSVSRKGEAIILRDGAPVVASAKVKEADEWVAKHFPSTRLLLNSLFSAQQQRGFLQATAAERKSLLLEALGIERLEGLATQAREEAKAARQRVDTAAARLADERARGGNAAELEQQLELAKAGAERAAALLESAKATLEAGHAESARVAQLQQENAELSRRRAALAEQRQAATTKLADAEERLVNNRQRLSEGDAIRAAVARLEVVSAELVEAETATLTAETAAREALAPWLDVNERTRAVQLRADRARARLKDQPAIEAAQRELPDLRDAEEEASRDVARLVAELEALDATHLAGADERIGKLRGGLDSIREAADANANAEADDLATIARETLEEDDSAVAQATTLPGRRKELRERLAMARDKVATTQRQLAEAERLAGRAGDLTGAETERDDADRELRELAEGYGAAGVAAKEKQATAAELRTKASQLRAERDALRPTADKAGKLDGCQARIEELEPVAAGLRSEIARVDADVAALPVPHELPPTPPLATLRDRVQDAERESAGAARVVTGLEQRLEQARASATRQAELEADEQAQLVELADWTRLAAGLGKDGLQALEIDAAGPELTELTNAILHRAHGPRFTLRVETQRTSADGKRQLEGCEVMVLDTVQGREAAGETFSGGERVILAEALSLAILVLSCRRAGLTDVSLVRDESGAALDPGNARVYVEMLRHAIELTGARHCLLVSHMPEVQELCDHRIEVGARTEARVA